MKLLVVGTGRSGTTLLQRVLSSHPDISMVRETFFYSIINQNHKFNKKNYYNSKVIIKYLKRYWWMHEIIDDWDSFENFYNILMIVADQIVAALNQNLAAKRQLVAMS